jgi:ABC-type Fe3+-hydroxamate transport system substrate-binding protein
MKRAGDNETPEQRFERLAVLRTNAVLDRLRILGNLSNRQMYKYSEEDVDKIFSAINQQIKEAKSRFNSRKREKFKL